MQTPRANHQDIDSLASKLATFTQSLTPGERAVFELIEAQLAELAIADDEDVTGYSFNPQLLDIANQRQAGYRADASRDRQSRELQATSASDASGDTGPQRMGFWRTVLGSLASQPFARPATEATGTS